MKDVTPIDQQPWRLPATKLSRALTGEEEDWAQWYHRTGNRLEASREVLAGTAATEQAVENHARYQLRKQVVLARLDEMRRQARAKSRTTVDEVFERVWAIATADPGQLSQYRRVCCRYCHGIDHRYQWREREWLEECERIVRLNATIRDSRLQQELPDGSGGFGFMPNLDPHPNCPECAGEGNAEAFFFDTRDLQGSARLLYAGTKVTKTGIEVMQHDQMKAMDMAIRMLGGYQDKLQLSGTVGHVNIPLTENQRQKLDALFEQEY